MVCYQLSDWVCATGMIGGLRSSGGVQKGEGRGAEVGGLAVSPPPGPSSVAPASPPTETAG